MACQETKWSGKGKGTHDPIKAYPTTTTTLQTRTIYIFLDITFIIDTI